MLWPAVSVAQSSESSLPMLCFSTPGLRRKSSPVLDHYPYKLDQPKIQFSHPSRTQQEIALVTQLDRTRRRDVRNVVESRGWDKSLKSIQRLPRRIDLVAKICSVQPPN